MSPFRNGLIKASSIVSTEPPVPLWFGLYPGAVTLLSGETGIGKSSLLYNIAVHAALNEPLWDVPFGVGEPLRVLYLDPENATARGHRLKNLREGLPDNLLFHNAEGFLMSDQTAFALLRDVVKAESIGLLILDPLANLFGTNDENDNAEAARQMKPLISLALETGCAILCVHHTGKQSEDGSSRANAKYGRGASARGCAARVLMTFTAKGEATEDDEYGVASITRRDLCRLFVAKDGIGPLTDKSLYLQMSGADRFERVSTQIWREGNRHSEVPRVAGRQEQVDTRILELLRQASAGIKRQELLQTLEREGMGRTQMDGAVTRLVKGGLILREGSGPGSPVRFMIRTEATP